MILLGNRLYHYQKFIISTKRTAYLLSKNLTRSENNFFLLK